MVAQNEISIPRDHDFRIGSRIQVIRGHVGFGNRCVIHIHVPIGNADAIARQPNHPLDEALARVARVMEHHNVSPLDAFKPVHQLVDENALLVFQAGLHAAALYLHRLVEKQDDKE